MSTAPTEKEQYIDATYKMNVTMAQQKVEKGTTSL